MIDTGMPFSGPTALTSRETVGCIGLGLMGSAMAANLLKAGYLVQGYDPNPQAMTRLQQRGGITMPHPAAASRDTNIVLVIVNHTAQVEQVLFSPNGVASALQSGAVVWIASTIPATSMRSFSQRLAYHDLCLVDGPVSGGLTGAEEATLTVIAGADSAALSAVRGVMQACCAEIHHVGDVGAGSTVKIINNLLAASHLVLTAEALTLGVKSGVDLTQLVQVITRSSGNSRLFEKRAPRIVSGDHTPHVSIQTFLKDLDIALDMASSVNSPAPMSNAASRVFRLAVQAGMAQASDTCLFDIYEQLGSAFIKLEN